MDVAKNVYFECKFLNAIKEVSTTNVLAFEPHIGFVTNASGWPMGDQHISIARNEPPFLV